MIFTGVSKYGSSMCPKTTNIMRKPFNESSLESLLLWQSTEYPPRLFVLNVENAFCIVVNGTFMLLIVGVVGEYQSLLRFLDRGE